jgi:hypothetical protein
VTSNAAPLAFRAFVYTLSAGPVQVGSCAGCSLTCQVSHSRWPGQAPGSLTCRGLYHVDVHPGAWHSTVRCPAPCGCAAIAGGQSHGVHDTSTRPGPHGCPAAQASGKLHQVGRHTSPIRPIRTRERFSPVESVMPPQIRWAARICGAVQERSLGPNGLLQPLAAASLRP